MNSQTLSMILGLCGGLGLFLYGMKMVGDGLERAAGDRLRVMLEKLTKNRFLGLLVGLLFTVIVQSSSATTVMAEGFVNAGLMTLTQATGIILGAMIGTTVTSQIIALNITQYAPLILLMGVVLIMSVKRKKLSHIAETIIGLGVLFIGITYMGDALAPLKENQAFVSILTIFENPILGIVTGAVFTCIIQSSSASVGILQVLAMQGMVQMGSAVYIVMGMNIGTCITGVIASLGASRQTKATAWMHVLFKVLGTAAFTLVLFLLPVVNWLEALSPGNVSRQIANMHTLFNLFTVLLLWPFLNKIESFFLAWISKGQEELPDEKHLRYLDPRLLDTPTIAVAQAAKEVERIGHLAIENIDAAMADFFAADIKNEEQIQAREDAVDFLCDQVTDYLIKVSQTELSSEDSATVGKLFHIINDYERMGDHAENIFEFAQQRHDEQIKFSGAGIAELQSMYQTLAELLSLSQTCFTNHGKTVLDQATSCEEVVDAMAEDLRERHIERLTRGLCTPKSGIVFTELLLNLERVGDHAINVVGLLAGKGDIKLAF